MKKIALRSSLALIALLAILAGTTARADGGWYVGASAGQAYLEIYDIEDTENVEMLSVGLSWVF